MTSHGSTAGPRAAAFTLIGSYGLLLGLVGPSVPAIQTTFEVTYRVAALHLTAISLGALIGAVAADRLGEAFGRRRLVQVATMVAALGAGAVAAAPVVAVGILGCLVAGVGGVVVANVGNAVIGEARGDGATEDLSLGQAAAAVGVVVSAALVALGGAVDRGWGWRLAWLAPAVVAAVVLSVRVAHALPDRVDDATADDADEGPTLEHGGVGDATARRLAAAMTGLGVAVEWGVTFWAAAFLVDELDLGGAASAGATALALTGLVVGRLLSARAGRRRRPTDLLRVVFLGIVVVFGAYLLGPRLGGAAAVIVVLAALAVLCVGVAMLFPLALAATMTNATSEQQARASSEAMGAGAVAGVVAPFTLGALADATSLLVAMTAVPALAALGGVLNEAVRSAQQRSTVDVPS